jgi:hypothetical protein
MLSAITAEQTTVKKAAEKLQNQRKDIRLSPSNLESSEQVFFQHKQNARHSPAKSFRASRLFGSDHPLPELLAVNLLNTLTNVLLNAMQSLKT